MSTATQAVSGDTEVQLAQPLEHACVGDGRDVVDRQDHGQCQALVIQPHQPEAACFSIITRQALRRGSFPTVADLIAAIERFIAAWNDRCRPFTWTKDPDTVIAKATDPRRRKTPTTSVTEH